MLNRVIVLLIVVCIVNYSNCICPDTFKNASADIFDADGHRDRISINGCVHNSRIKRFELKSSTREILQGTFVNMTLLHSLILSNAGIYVIEAGFAENLPRLTGLSVSENIITEIRYNVFHKLPLNDIYLENNAIHTIASGAFSDINLTDLSLKSNKLKSVNSDWFLNTTIRYLYLGDNKIESLYAETFSGVIGMEYLDLAINKIYYIDYDTFSNQHALQNLNLQENSLLGLSFKITNNLQVLHVSFNLISSISLENTTSLRTIVIIPNPWACNCLQRFVNESKSLGINLKQYDSVEAVRSDTPVCVVVDTACDNSLVPVDTVRKEYFRRVRYEDVLTTRYEFWFRYSDWSYPTESYYQNVTFEEGGTPIGAAK